MSLAVSQRCTVSSVQALAITSNSTLFPGGIIKFLILTNVCRRSSARLCVGMMMLTRIMGALFTDGSTFPAEWPLNVAHTYSHREARPIVAIAPLRQNLAATW